MSAWALIPMAMQAVGAFMQAGSQSAQYKSSAQWAAYNAQVARNQQQAVYNAAEFSMKRIRRKEERMVSSQEAAYAKAGVELQGTPIEVIADTMNEFELDMLSEQYNAQMQMNYLSSEANINEWQAAQYRSMGKTMPLASLLTAGANMFSSYKFGGTAPSSQGIF